MEPTSLLLEYLKEQYTQARQHETRQTAATTFLTAAAGLLLGGDACEYLKSNNWETALLIFLIGLANWQINEANFKGNRFHARLAGYTRIELEKALSPWPADIATPTALRDRALKELGIIGNVGEKVHQAMRLVPIGVMVIGILLLISAVLNL